ncbi:hypothetical protein ACLOJK_028477 [Asimina triloba]
MLVGPLGVYVKDTGIQLQLERALDVVTRNGHSMDATAPATVISPELVRESLIAISQAIPDKIVSSKLLPDDTNNVITAQPEDTEEVNFYRSKLISISYTESPDSKTLASSSPGNLKGSD